MPLVDLAVVLPLGISFFTFTQIAYLVDSCMRQGRANAVPCTTRCSSPISRTSSPARSCITREMMPQFARLRRPTSPHLRNLAIGCRLLRDRPARRRCSPTASRRMRTPSSTRPTRPRSRSGVAWQGVLAYTLQIYFDFSGYSDMAVGLSLLFGVRLPYNFNSPYKARNIIDFWRRWHMTLSRFLRDYLYVPLGGNRHGPVRRYGTSRLTMLLGGLWHGAAWTFVIWGGLHGFYLIVNHLWQHVTAGIAGPRPAAGRGALHLLSSLAGNALTLLAVAVAWVFFRATTFSQAAAILKGMYRLERRAERRLRWRGLSAFGCGWHWDS